MGLYAIHMNLGTAARDNNIRTIFLSWSYIIIFLSNNYAVYIKQQENVINGLWQLHGMCK